MGAFDWVSLGVNNKLHRSAGQLNVTLGTKVDSTFGGAVTHTFGTSVELVCSPTQFLMGGVGASIGMAILTGAGGNATFTFGAYTNAVYQGPSWDIRRATFKEKHSDYFLPTPFGAPPVPPPDPVDPTTFAAIRPLGILAVVVPAAFEIALHFAYKDTNPADYNATLENMKWLNDFLSSRLLGIMKAIESGTGDVQIGERLAIEGAAALAGIGQMLTKIHAVFKSSEKEAVKADEQFVAAANAALAALRAESY